MRYRPWALDGLPWVWDWAWNAGHCLYNCCEGRLEAREEGGTCRRRSRLSFGAYRPACAGFGRDSGSSALIVSSAMFVAVAHLLTRHGMGPMAAKAVPLHCCELCHVCGCGTFAALRTLASSSWICAKPACCAHPGCCVTPRYPPSLHLITASDLHDGPALERHAFGSLVALILDGFDNQLPMTNAAGCKLQQHCQGAVCNITAQSICSHSTCSLWFS